MRVLTFNSHEAYIYDLARTGWDLDVVVNLAGHHHEGWDERMRPLPPNIRLLELGSVRTNQYDCVIAHNITDLLATRAVQAARVLTLHSSLHGRISQEASDLSASEISDVIKMYMNRVNGQIVVISEMKRESWGLDATVIPGAVDGEDYQGYQGTIPSGLRVANHISLKRKYLEWEFHEAVFHDQPCQLVGVNPDLPGVNPATSWDELKKLYRTHRFIVHTASEGLEDGYNLALLEGMATGMPVITNDTSTSPVVHGENGFRSDDPEILREGVRQLLESPDLAREMGEEARATVLRDFGISAFIKRWQDVVNTAVQTQT